MSAHTDTLSLTLPDWRAAAKKVRRWKPPRPTSLFAALQLAFSIYGLALATFERDVVGIVWMAAMVAGWWRWTWRSIPVPMNHVFPVVDVFHVSQPRIATWLDWLFLAFILFQWALGLAAIFGLL